MRARVQVLILARLWSTLGNMIRRNLRGLVEAHGENVKLTLPRLIQTQSSKNRNIIVLRYRPHAEIGTVAVVKEF